jgi:monofunctional biosynthetic peptidoglycan transglycosylase
VTARRVSLGRPPASRLQALRRIASLKRCAALLLVLALLAAVGLLLSLPDVSALRRHDPPTTAFIELRRKQVGGQPLRLQRHVVPLASISPYLRKCVVLAEDDTFYEHEGFNWEAIRKSAEANWEEGRLVRGGSTLTQQLARNLYLSPEKSWLRKLREALITFRLEHTLSKRRILELYLNLAEWGDGIFGAEAASQAYYGIAASALSPAQAARLAVALPSPSQRNPRVQAQWLDRRAARLCRLLRRAGTLDETQYQRALDELRARQ